MTKKFARVIAIAIVAGGTLVAGAGTASADHCVEGDSPGFSYFGRDGRFDGGAESNARVCREVTGSPSMRAPGQN